MCYKKLGIDGVKYYNVKQEICKTQNRMENHYWLKNKLTEK